MKDDMWLLAAGVGLLLLAKGGGIVVRPGDNIQAALDSGKSPVNIQAGSYPIVEPLTIRRSNLTVNMDPAAVIRPTVQIDGGIFQIVDNGLVNVKINGGVLDGNNLSMMGVWIAKKTSGFVLSNMEIKNIRGVVGLLNTENVCGVLAQAQTGMLISGLRIHDISALDPSLRNGAAVWLTGDVGISQPENTVVRDCVIYNTVNTAAGVLIDGVKFDVNTIGLRVEGCGIRDVSGEGVNILAGGVDISGPNKSNDHTVKNNAISNARRGLFLNANNGGEVLRTQVSGNTILSCREYGIFEWNGSNLMVLGNCDFGVFTGNTVPQGLVKESGAGSHDIYSGNVGF